MAPAYRQELTKDKITQSLEYFNAKAGLIIGKLKLSEIAGASALRPNLTSLMFWGHQPPGLLASRRQSSRFRDAALAASVCGEVGQARSPVESGPQPAANSFGNRAGTDVDGAVRFYLLAQYKSDDLVIAGLQASTREKVTSSQERPRQLRIARRAITSPIDPQ